VKKYLLILLILSSCRAAQKQHDPITPAEADVIVFVTFNIHKDSISNKNNIEMISKTRCSGTIKKQPEKIVNAENFLTVYIYDHKNLVDSIIMAHPLYKHFEYIDENNHFAVKDTVIDKADFFLRVQAPGTSGRMSIFETLKNHSKEELTTIKL